MKVGHVRRNRFAECLKAKRIETGLGQIAFAKMLGIAQPTLAKYETRNREPDLDGLLTICECLHMTPNEMLGFADQASPLPTISAGDGAVIAIGEHVQQTVHASRQRKKKENP